MSLKRTVHVWYSQEQPSMVKKVTTYAVCGCGVHVGVRAETLICPKCKMVGIRETPDGKPGEFTVAALYERPEN